MDHEKLQTYQKHWVDYFYQKPPATFSRYVTAFIRKAHEVHRYYRILDGIISQLFITPHDHAGYTNDIAEMITEIEDIICILYLFLEESEFPVEQRHKQQLEKIIAKLEHAVSRCKFFIKRIQQDVIFVSLGERKASRYDEIPYRICTTNILQEYTAACNYN